MSRGLSVKLSLVLAAVAFVIGFRIQASSDDDPARLATTLSPSGARALASDASVQPVARGIAAPALAAVAALPALHRAPARPRPQRTALPSATPTASAVPVVSPTAPATTAKPAPTKKSYVGKSFDTEG